MPGRIQLPRAVLLLAGMHFMMDVYSNIYAPLLPLLIPKLALSLAGAGTLAMFFQIAASVSQLGFGHLADRWHTRALVLVGPVIAVAFSSLIGLANSAASLAAVLVLGGLGNAAFHPTAAALVHRMGGARRGLAMSVHVTAGTVGYALAPLLFAPFVQHYGLQWTPVLALPGLAVLAVFLPRLPPMTLHTAGHSAGLGALRPYWKPLFFLYTIVVLRTLVSLSFATFVPVMLTERGMSIGEAGAATTLFLVTGGIGGFAGGPLADRIGPRKVIALSVLVAAPLLAWALTLSGWKFLVVLAAGGFFLQSTLPVNITYAHAIAPVSAGTVSSLMMGVAWGTGGMCAPLIGMLADRIGIASTLSILAFFPLIAALCVIPLPSGPLPTSFGQPAPVGLSEPT